MVSTFPVFLLIVIAVGAGLLAVLALWVIKRIANPETRAQGITVAVISLAVVAVGFLVTVPVSDRLVSNVGEPAQVAPQAPMASIPPTNSSPSSSVIMDSSGRMEVHIQQQPSAPVNHAVAQLAWGKLAFAAVVIGVIILAASSRKSLRAALAGLGIVAALLLVYLLRSSAINVAQMPSVIPPVASSAMPPANETKADEILPTSPRDRDESKEISEKLSADHGEAEQPDKPRPDWIGTQPKLENGVYYAAVESGPYSTTWEAEGGLDAPLRDAVQKYVDRYMPVQSRWFGLGRLDLIKGRLVKDRYVERVQASFGPMVKLHALVKIDQNDRAYFDQLAYHAQVQEAVAKTSVGAAFVFGALVLLYGGLRYTGRKKSAAGESATTTEAIV